MTADNEPNDSLIRLGMILPSSYNCPTAIDQKGVYIIDRVSRAPRIGYDYFEKHVLFKDIAHLHIYPETAVKRFISATLGIICCAVFAFILLVAYMEGVYVIHFGVLFLPFAVVALCVSYFTARGTYLSVKTAQSKHTTLVSAKTWSADGRRIVELIRQSSRPYDISSHIRENA